MSLPVLIHPESKIVLSKALVGNNYKCVGVLDSSSEFLKYLDKHHIEIGTLIHILNLEEFDQSMTMEIDNKTMVMSKAITSNIYVTKE